MSFLPYTIVKTSKHKFSHGGSLVILCDAVNLNLELLQFQPQLLPLVLPLLPAAGRIAAVLQSPPLLFLVLNFFLGCPCSMI